MSDEAQNTYTGRSHCGAVTFEVDGRIDQLLSCNCSICRRKGSLLWFVPRTALRVKGEENLATYTFNKHFIHHRFCKTCGMHPYGEAKDGTGAGINARCLDLEDLSPFPRVDYDGRSL